MPLPEQFSSFWKEYDLDHSSLHRSVKKLYDATKENQGLSRLFKEKVCSQQEAMRLCEQAMEKLAEHYIGFLTQFKAEESPLKALEALHEAEKLWKGNASLIEQFDTGGSEKEFLRSIRTQSLQVLEHKLERYAKKNKRIQDPEALSLCVGILLTMDHIFGELGEEENSANRSTLRELALALKD